MNQHKIQVKYKVKGIYVEWLYKQKTIKTEIPTDQLGFWQMKTLSDKLDNIFKDKGCVMSFKVLDE